MKEVYFSALLLISICEIYEVNSHSTPLHACGDSGWVAYEDVICFKLIEEFKNRDEAEHKCNELKVHGDCSRTTLASIKSLSEQEFLINHFSNAFAKGESVWIGAKRVSETCSQFVWNDGSPVDFVNWDTECPAEVSEGKDCVHMQSMYSRQSPSISKYQTKPFHRNGMWRDVKCSKRNYFLCERLQTWSCSQTQTTILHMRNELINVIDQLNVTQNEFKVTQNELKLTRDELKLTKNELVETKSKLDDTRNQIGPMINSRLFTVEGAFSTTFEVGGSIHYYYPVAFELLSKYDYARTPLMYDIYRSHYEKAPESLTLTMLTLKLMSTDGGWDSGDNALKVLFHQWFYNKGVAKVQLFWNQEARLFVWLRGGGVLYHIRSPSDLNGKITIYLDDNTVVAPPVVGADGTTYPAVIVNPILVGSEDPNLVKTGAYEGWAF